MHAPRLISPPLTACQWTLVAGCTLAVVGSNSAGGSKTVDIGSSNACPALVNRDNWYFSDAFSDETFTVAQLGTSITVTRWDSPKANAAWTLDLRFLCCSSGTLCILPLSPELAVPLLLAPVYSVRSRCCASERTHVWTRKRITVITAHIVGSRQRLSRAIFVFRGASEGHARH